MKINSFKANNVHNYLKFDIEFYPELTFLIGINGSGKTSVLKLILGLTSPSFQYLNQIDFEYCEVICSSKINEKDILIRAEQDKKKNTLKVTFTMSGKETSRQFPRFTRSLNSQYDYEEFTSIEQRSRQVFDGSDVTKRIREIATPKFLGLDRRIYDGRSIDSLARKRNITTHSIYRKKIFEGYADPTKIDTSLEEVQILVFDYIRKIAQEQTQITDDFKQQIFKQSFSYVEGYSLDPIPTEKEIQEKKTRVLSSISNLNIEYLNFTVNSFFNKIIELAKENSKFSEEEKYEKDAISDKYLNLLKNWYNNGSQLKRIDDILKYSKEFQEKVAALRSPIEKLENIITNFLMEENKTLEVSPTGEIKVCFDKGMHSNIFELSSGEKQIITMIAHLIFEEAQKPSGIFIIDEPELSLHMAWQEIFVDSIVKASPKTQFILATHSPSIISKVDREKNCQNLNFLNKNNV